MSDLNLAVIGNCSYGALIDKQARIVWACLPRFDSDPVFCSLMDGGEDASDLGISPSTSKIFRAASNAICITAPSS